MVQGWDLRLFWWRWRCVLPLHAPSMRFRIVIVQVDSSPITIGNRNKLRSSWNLFRYSWHMYRCWAFCSAVKLRRTDWAHTLLYPRHSCRMVLMLPWLIPTWQHVHPLLLIGYNWLQSRYNDRSHCTLNLATNDWYELHFQSWLTLSTTKAVSLQHISWDLAALACFHLTAPYN